MVTMLKALAGPRRAEESRAGHQARWDARMASAEQALRLGAAIGQDSVGNAFGMTQKLHLLAQHALAAAKLCGEFLACNDLWVEQCVRRFIGLPAQCAPRRHTSCCPSSPARDVFSRTAALVPACAPVSI